MRGTEDWLDKWCVVRMAGGIKGAWYRGLAGQMVCGSHRGLDKGYVLPKTGWINVVWYSWLAG